MHDLVGVSISKHSLRIKEKVKCQLAGSQFSYYSGSLMEGDQNLVMRGDYPWSCRTSNKILQRGDLRLCMRTSYEFSNKMIGNIRFHLSVGTDVILVEDP